jgi:hypothetical protein
VSIGCGHWQVAVSQAVVYAGIVGLTFVVARELVGGPELAAALVALYLPLAYFGALELSEVLATVLLLLAVALYARARRGAIAWWLACGAACGFLALTRPIFLPLPLVFMAAELVGRTGAGTRRSRALAAILGGAALIEAPFVGYSLLWFHEPSVSTSGTVLWAGYLQGKTAGSAADLDQFKLAALSGASDATISTLGDRIGLDRVESPEVAAAFREAAVFEASPDQRSSIAAFLTLDRQLQARAVRLIQHDPIGYLARGLSVRTPSLWATDLPIRAARIESVPIALRILIFTFEFVLLFAAIAGGVMLVRSRDPLALLVVGCFFYVWILSLPFLTEARYAIPARPVQAILLGPVAGRFFARRGALQPR